MGIPISIDPTWLIIFAVLTFELSTGVLPTALGFSRRRGVNIETILLGLLTSLLFFGSVLAHELSHSWMALKRGIPVLGITLFIFGGVAQIGDEADRPSTEFLVAIMGPLMSLALACVFAVFWIWPLALFYYWPDTRTWLLPVAVVASYLSTTNGILVVFNLLPGFPMDGGRVLRALLWGRSHDLPRSTRIAMLIGRGIAVLLVLFGIWSIWQSGFNGVWWLLIGGFLWNAAGEAYRSTLFRESLKNVAVGNIMSIPIAPVPANLGLSNFIEQYLIPYRGGVYRIEQEGRTVGLVGGGQVRDIPRERWQSLTVQEVMLTPSAENVTPQDSALTVFKKLTQRAGQDGKELPVVHEGQLVGLVGHPELARYLDLKAK
ncbi:MAG: site-2 protease family protein [Anaerolineae bacterium]